MRKTALRSMKMHTRYLTTPKQRNFMKTAPSLVEFKEWRIIDNTFPYDTIAKTHHMLVPKRQFARPLHMDEYEVAELEGLLEHVLPETYDMIALNFPRQQSVKDWLHYHLIVLKQ